MSVKYLSFFKQRQCQWQIQDVCHTTVVKVEYPIPCLPCRAVCAFPELSPCSFFLSAVKKSILKRQQFNTVEEVHSVSMTAFKMRDLSFTQLTCGLCYYTGCPRRKGPNFRRVFLGSNYTDITQNTYIQSSMVTEILAREV